MTRKDTMRLVRRRTAWLIAVAIVAILLVAGVTTALVRAKSDDPVANGCGLPTAAPQTPAVPASEAPGGGGVKVTETAFSPTEGDNGVGMAAVVQNTSKAQVAYRTTVTFAMTTPAGQNALYPDAGPDMVIVIPVLLPGEHLGVANWAGLYPDSQGTPAAPGTMTVTVSSTHWIDRDTDEGRIFQPVGTKNKGIQRTDPEKPTVGNARVLVTSSYCRAVGRHGVALLFRDAGGRLIGGTRIVDASISLCRPGTRVDGDSARTIQGIPTAADLDRTETYAYCDIVEPPAEPSGSPIGINYV
ncbi:hypothetical protein [Cryptosporangium sp. NPDC051539]|uniref:hypothetical protein n=1 Tax=Cryptosporangium sp. NPDC051539 TaxID=3363962 RepID=UPI0037BC7F7D